MDCDWDRRLGLLMMRVDLMMVVQELELMMVVQELELSDDYGSSKKSWTQKLDWNRTRWLDWNWD